MLGPVELRSAYIWCEVYPSIKTKLEYWKPGDYKNRITDYPEITERYEFTILEFYLTALEPGTTYEYQLIIDKKQKPPKASGKFTTQELWQYRKPAPDFKFLTGSCAFFNEPIYDRPGKPYGGDSSIFETMSNENAAFMLWLGDNWYYREVDCCDWGLWYRASRDRSHKVLQNFLKSMSHYAIWDDHDFGPNNAGNEWLYRNEARKVFDSYWCNPAKYESYDGIYTRFSFNDVDFFLMDSRTFRTSDNHNDSINGKPNPGKIMWGAEQLKWLKNQLINSRAPFKIIANGSPILNTYNKYDCLVHFVNEYNELMDFIAQEKITGVLFFSGDRHHSEIISKKTGAGYSTYEIVSSSLTSGIYKVPDSEKTNPDLIKESIVEQNNYTRVSVSGKPKDRKMKFEFMDVKGKPVFDWEIHENQLK